VDPLALVLLVGAFVVAQLRFIPVRVRYGLMGAAFAAMGLLRLRTGASGMNLPIAGLIFALAVYYLFKAARTRSP
jgi:hypothetical protein